MGNQLGGSISLESYEIEQFAADRAMNASGTTNAVNVSESGVLISVGIYKSVAWTGSPTMNLEIQVDGGTTKSINICATNTSFHADNTPYYVSDGSSVVGLMFHFGSCRYQTSLRVGLNVTAGGSAGTARFFVIKGKKL